ncbi:MAG: hypothetical protein H0Z37_11875 [Firmicutes bacterium]|nr:hypothetical protein [Bacillota bacterium]
MIIAGCTVLGIGIGLLFDSAAEGTLIGLGVGLILDPLLRRKSAAGKWGGGGADRGGAGEPGGR